MADAKPSLTPHRDQVEELLKSIDAAAEQTGHWQDRLAQRMIREIHRAMADERDAGRTVAEIGVNLPFFMHNCASALLGAIGMRDDMLPALMSASVDRKRLSDRSVEVSAPMPAQTGGQA